MYSEIASLFWEELFSMLNYTQCFRKFQISVSSTIKFNSSGSSNGIAEGAPRSIAESASPSSTLVGVSLITECSLGDWHVHCQKQ